MKMTTIEGEEDNLRYMVTGQSGKTYLVDLTANDGIGFCGCPDFEYRNKHTKQKDYNEHRCKHIRFARAVIAFGALDRHIAERCRTSDASRENKPPGRD